MNSRKSLAARMLTKHKGKDMFDEPIERALNQVDAISQKLLEQIDLIEKQTMDDIFKVRQKSSHCKRWMVEARNNIQIGLMCLKRAIEVPQGD